MRAFKLGVVLCVWVSVGCESIDNYYGCAVDDGGTCMGRADDRWGDDELASDAGSGHGANNSIFTQDSRLQDSATCVQGATAIALIDAQTKGGVPRLVTVNLATPVRPAAFDAGMVPLPVEAEAVATIELGVGGTLYQAEVDYGMGVQFSLVASRIRVLAEYRQFVGLAVPATPNQVSLGASIGQGTVAPTHSPTRTIVRQYALPGIAPGAAGEMFAIPMFAKSMMLFTDTNPAGVGPVTQVRLYREGLGSDSLTNLVTTPSQELPLAGDMRYVQLSNVGAVNVLAWRAVFTLAL